jgi:Lar family restriction alleviation protein
MKREEELKPCPFCGASAHIEQYGDARQSTKYQCDDCGCMLETGEEWDFGRDWNRRALISNPKPEVEDDWFSQVVAFFVKHGMLDERDEYDIRDVMAALHDNYTPIDEYYGGGRSFVMRKIAESTENPKPEATEGGAHGKAEAFDRICVAYKAYVDAVREYNDQRALATKERARGNWSITVDPEYRAMSEAQSIYIRTADSECRAALTAKEGGE